MSGLEESVSDNTDPKSVFQEPKFGILKRRYSITIIALIIIFCIFLFLKGRRSEPSFLLKTEVFQSSTAGNNATQDNGDCFL